MTLFFEYVIVGIVEGFIIGTLAFAIVLLVKATGFVNFSQGAMSTFAVFVVYELYLKLHNIAAALLIGLVVALVLGVAIYLIVLRPNASDDPLNMLMRSVGVYLLLEALINLFWSAGQPFSLPNILPASNAFGFMGVVISWNTVGTICVTVTLMALFAFFFRHTSTGLLFLGVADSAEIATLVGIKLRRLSLVAWAMSGLLALVVGVLIEPSAFLTTTMTDPILLFSFAAAVIGGLKSLSGAIVGGIVMGIANALLTAYSGPNSATVLIFVVILILFQIWPNGIFGRSTLERL
jgi:branched-chain amino acid transport system permease protein